jgi:hypothetical protein
MVFSVSLLVFSVLAIPLALILGARRWSLAEARVDARLHSPAVPTVAYVVPEGQDPALVRVALTHAGFATVLDRSGDQQLLVECDNGHRERARHVIEGLGGLEGPDVPIGHVRFVDEPV